MPKIYTKTGDRGSTGLYSFKNRLRKSNFIFEVLGNLDYLSSKIGLLCSVMTNIDQKSEENSRNVLFLRGIQNKLLDIGSSIVTLDKREELKIKEISVEDVQTLETEIDNCEKKNSKLTDFILVGVFLSDSIAHECRAIARTVERNLWKLDEEGIFSHTSFIRGDVFVDCPLEEQAYIYVNRLSDYFFVLARNLSGCTELKRGELIK